MVKGKFDVRSDGRIGFMCPGCGEEHIIPVNRPDGCGWSFNGNYDAPTISPSILTRSGHYASNEPGDCWCNFEERFPDEGPAPFHCKLCHIFVTDGKIQYLSDCSHKLAGQTIDMVEPVE